MSEVNVPVGISTAHFAYDDPDDAFEKCVGWGFDHIEFFNPKFSQDDYRRIAQLSHKYGIAVDYHPPYMDEYDLGVVGVDGGIKAIERIVDIALLMDAKYVVIHMGTYSDRAKSLDDFARVIEHIAPRIEGEGLFLCVENFTLCHGDRALGDRSEDFDFLFGRVRSKNVGMSLDYGHGHITGNTLEYLRKFGDKLLHTHVDDNNGRDDEHLGVGDGTIDWEKVLEATARTGFKGPYIIEGHPGIVESMRKVRDILSRVSY
ncbi:MAG: sugar phosphate isomerase/epimerase family protein [bacterium]